MAYEIEQRKVAGVVIEANQALSGKDFNHGEIVLGLAELLGRVIVDAAPHHIAAKELYDVAINHINKTIAIGSHASGKSLIERA